MSVRLSVVLPTYNEAANIAPMLLALREALGPDAELLVVDDNSPDGTADAARAAEAAATVLVRTQEKGLGTAVVHGFRHAQGEYVLVMDTDFQHPPEVAARMLTEAVATNADLVVGSRYVKGGTEGDFGLVRRTISKGAATMSRVFLPPVRVHQISDPMSGLFLVRRDRLDLDALDPKGYKILLEVLAKAPLERVSEVGYRFDTRREGDSKLGGAVILQYLLHLALLGGKHPDNQRMFRFAAVGLSGVLVNLLLLAGLTELAGLHYFFSAIIAIEASIVSNFLLNDRFTFRDRRRGHFLERLLRFNAVSVGALVVNLTTLFLLTEIFGIHYLVSEAIAITAAFGANYLGNLHWTYGGLDRLRARDQIRRLSPWVPLLLVSAAAGGLFLQDLDRADEIYFDEHYYVSIAYQINDGVWEDPCWAKDELDHRPLNFEHPPLAKLIIAWSVTTFDPDQDAFKGCRDSERDPTELHQECIDLQLGDCGEPNDYGKRGYKSFTDRLRDHGNPFAWRVPSVVFGTLTVLFAGIAAGRLFKEPAAGPLAGAFVAMDGIIFTSARLAILDIYATAFAMIALAFATVPGRRGMIPAALALAIGFTAKFTVAFLGLPILLVLLWTNHRAGRLRRRFFDGTVALFVLLPNLFLAFSYLPWWRIWVPIYGFFGAIRHWFAVMAAAIGWGTSVQSSHPYGIPAWEWILMRRPTFYYGSGPAGREAAGDDVVRKIYAVGNPILWWAAAIAVLAVIIDAVVRMARGTGKLPERWAALGGTRQAAVMASLVPVLGYASFSALTRETFLFYMTILVPVLAIALAGILMQAWQRGSMLGRIGLPVVLLGVIAAFLHYFPIVTAADLTQARFEGIIDAVPWMRP